MIFFLISTFHQQTIIYNLRNVLLTIIFLPRFIGFKGSGKKVWVRLNPDPQSCSKEVIKKGQSSNVKQPDPKLCATYLAKSLLCLNFRELILTAKKAPAWELKPMRALANESSSQRELQPMRPLAMHESSIASGSSNQWELQPMRAQHFR